MHLKSRPCFRDETPARPSPLILEGLEQPWVNCEAGPGPFPAPSYARDGLLQRSPGLPLRRLPLPCLVLRVPGSDFWPEEAGARWPAVAPSQAGGYSAFCGRKRAGGLVLAEGFLSSDSVPIQIWSWHQQLGTSVPTDSAIWGNS